MVPVRGTFITVSLLWLTSGLLVAFCKVITEEGRLGTGVSPKAADKGWIGSVLRVESCEISLSLAKASPYGLFNWLPAALPARDAAPGA